MNQSKNLYSAQRFGVTVKNDTPRLVVDTGNITSIGDLKWSEHQAQFDKLKENESSVIAISMRADGALIDSGWRVTRLPDFRMNRVVFDEHAKEHVLLTNATERDGTCVPLEGIALRVFIENGKATCAWTYRGVDPCRLRACDENGVKGQFEAVLSRRRSARFIGRI